MVICRKKRLVEINLAITVKERHSMNDAHALGGFYFGSIKT